MSAIKSSGSKLLKRLLSSQFGIGLPVLLQIDLYLLVVDLSSLRRRFGQSFVASK